MAQMRMLLQEARVVFHKQAAEKCAYKKALLTLAFIIFFGPCRDKICILLNNSLKFFY